MSLTRSDLDQAARHFIRAREQLAGLSFLSKHAALQVVDLAVAKLVPGDNPMASELEQAAIIAALRHLSRKVPAGAARVSIQKGIAVLVDRAPRSDQYG